MRLKRRKSAHPTSSIESFTRTAEQPTHPVYGVSVLTSQSSCDFQYTCKIIVRRALDIIKDLLTDYAQSRPQFNPPILLHQKVVIAIDEAAMEKAFSGLLCKLSNSTYQAPPATTFLLPPGPLHPQCTIEARPAPTPTGQNAECLAS